MGSPYRYDQNPTQDSLVNALSISRQWSISNLYGYALDHFRRQFQGGKIHPAVALGVARRFGIPELIEPAVKALARPDIAFSTWSTDVNIVCHTTVVEVGTIGRMKEKLLLARFALCGVPPVLHEAICSEKSRSRCSASWRGFWTSTVVPRLTNLDGEIENLLWWIRTDCITKACVQGMTDRCMERTVNEVIGNVGWRSEGKIPEGAVNLLMVPERIMLEPQLDDVHMTFNPMS